MVAGTVVVVAGTVVVVAAGAVVVVAGTVVVVVAAGTVVVVVVDVEVVVVAPDTVVDVVGVPDPDEPNAAVNSAEYAGVSYATAVAVGGAATMTAPETIVIV